MILLVLPFCLRHKRAKKTQDAPPHFVCSSQRLRVCGRASGGRCPTTLSPCFDLLSIRAESSPNPNARCKLCDWRVRLAFMMKCMTIIYYRNDVFTGFNHSYDSNLSISCKKLKIDNFRIKRTKIYTICGFFDTTHTPQSHTFATSF